MKGESVLDFYDLVIKRCSIRSYERNRSIPEEVLNRILNAGRVAPSANNLQPWHFHVIRSTEILEKIYPCYKHDWIQSAPCILIVTGDRNRAWVRRQDNYNSIETDLTIVMDHLILAATWEGVGTCWIAAFDPNILREALKLEPNIEVFAFTTLGYAAQDSFPLPKKRKSLEEITSFF
jgi:nitroreductase